MQEQTIVRSRFVMSTSAMAALKALWVKLASPVLNRVFV